MDMSKPSRVAADGLRLLPVAGQRAYVAGCEWQGMTLLDAWAAELDGPARVSPWGALASACFEAGVLEHAPPRWVTGWRYGALPEDGYSRNHRDDCAEPGVSVMQIDGEPACGGTFALFNSDRLRVRVAGWLIGRRGSDGEPLLIGAVSL